MLSAGRALKHIIFFIADHFEPAGYDIESLKIYFAGYKALMTRHGDSYGNYPKFTWFYRDGETGAAGLLAEMSRSGLGEAELHLHHGRGTENAAANDAGRLADLINSRVKFLRGSVGSGEKRYGFIHGMWALDNSRGGEYCGVNNELQVLRETGCFADFTFPAWGDMQPAKVNSIYYAKDDPLRAKSYNTGIDAAVGQRPEADLLIFEGPAGSALEILLDKNKLDTALINSWVKARISVAGRDEWIFVKTNIHSLGTGHKEKIFDVKIFDTLFSYLEQAFDDGKRYRLHYATAREAYNIVRAAEDGREGDPEDNKDHLIRPYAIVSDGLRERKKSGITKRVNTAFLADDLCSMCGLTRNLLENVKWLNRDKFNLFIYALDGSRIAEEFAALDAVTIRNLRFKKTDPSAYLRIINLLRSDGIEILHSYPFVSNMIGPFLARIAGVRRVITSVHSDAIIKNRLLSKLSYGLSDRVIVVSEYLREMLKSRRGLADNKIKTIYNGVDPVFFNPEESASVTRESVGASKNDVLIMTTANFRWEKGHEYLVRAAKEMKTRGGSFKFLLVGTGPMEAGIRAMSKESGVDDMFLFMGYRDDVRRLLSLCDIFVLPSVSEGFGTSLIEAMAMKKPVIATAVGGIRESVKDGENGLLIKPADPGAISDAIYKLAKNEPLRKLMGERGRQIAQGRFDSRDRASDLERLYLYNA